MSTHSDHVTLFSIPGSVTFPHSHVPLHVFEPRYREMVTYCLENKIMMGVCHTQKTLHQKSESQSLEEVLNSNQSTYKPQRIFSIGEVELIETLEDGRMHIVVNMCARVQLDQEVQTLPFSIVKVTPLPDIHEGDKDDDAKLTLLKEKIITRLSALFSRNDELVRHIKSDELKGMSNTEFSFYIFSIIRFDPDAQQSVLEMRSAVERLELLLDVINQH